MTSREWQRLAELVEEACTRKVQWPNGEVHEIGGDGCFSAFKLAELLRKEGAALEPRFTCGICYEPWKASDPPHVYAKGKP